MCKFNDLPSLSPLISHVVNSIDQEGSDWEYYDLVVQDGTITPDYVTTVVLVSLVGLLKIDWSICWPEIGHTWSDFEGAEWLGF